MIRILGKEIRARSFVFHEFFKFYPELVLAHLLSLSYKIDSSMFKGTSIDWVDYLKKSVINLSLLQSWFPTEEYVFAFNGVGWFLSSLFFCYLLTPLAIKCLKRLKNHAFVGLVMCVVLRYVYVYTFRFWGDGNTFLYTNVFPPYRFFEYFAGMCLGLLYKQNPDRHQNSLIQVCGIAVFAFMLYVNANSTLIHISALFLVYAFVFYSGFMDWIGEQAFLSLFAKITMQFYLFHNPIIYLYTWITWKHSIDIYKHPIVTMLLFLATGLVFSYVVYRIRALVQKSIENKQSILKKC